MVIDGNGDTVGVLLDGGGLGATEGTIYNETLGLIMSLGSLILQQNGPFGVPSLLEFESSGCQGQAFLPPNQTGWPWAHRLLGRFEAVAPEYYVTHEQVATGTEVARSYRSGGGCNEWGATPVDEGSLLVSPYVPDFPFEVPLKPPLKIVPAP